jgi:hypothetical protein
MVLKVADSRWLRAVLFLSIGLAAGWVASALWAPVYTSHATILVTPPLVPQELMPRTRIDAQSVMDDLVPVVFSDGALMLYVTDHDLYPARLSQTTEELGRRFRRSLRVEPHGRNLIRISCTYGELSGGEENAKKAQSAVVYFVSALIDGNIRKESNSMYASMQFFDDQAEAAGKQLVRAEAKLRATPPSDPQYSLASLDRDLKRKEYEAIGEKRAAASLLSQLRNRKQDQTLELLDPATLPQEPDTSPWFPRLGGLIAGLAAWLLIECRPRQGAVVAASQESEVGVREA